MLQVSQYIGNYSTKKSSTCVLKALLVARRIVSWQKLRMDKCMCVVHVFDMRVDAWFDATYFYFCTTCHKRVPFGGFVLYNAKNSWVIKANI